MYPQLTKVTQGIFCRYEKYGFYPSIYTGTRHMEWFKERFFHLSSATAYPDIARGLVAYYNDQREGKKFALMLTGWVRELCEHTYWEHDHNKGSGEHQAEDSLGIYPKEKRTRAEVINRSFFKAAWIMYAGHKSAALLTEMGHADEAAKVNRYLTAFNDRVLNDPNLKLYDPQMGLWDPGAFARMGSDNLTLLGDLRPRKTDAELIKSIAGEMKELGYMTIGVKSVYNLLSTVTQGGYADTAAAVLQRQEYPSMLYSIAHTGGTVAEGWNHQHSYAQIEGLASVGRWFYCDLVGIEPSIAKPAWGQFELRPHVPADVHKFDFTYDSPRGLIESHWNGDGEQVVWSVAIPPNAVADVSIPGKAVQGVNEEGVTLVRSEKDREVYRVGSGRYTFRFIKVLPISPNARSAEQTIPAPPAAAAHWPSEPPTNCLFAKSDTLTEADTWYPSWGADDRLYSPFTDGTVNGVKSGSGGGKAVVGHAIIEGRDPLDLNVIEPATIPGDPAPYGGRYPCGSLHYRGVWYVGTYGLASAPYGLNWPIMGPCAGFHISTNNGKAWTLSPRSCAPGKALFPEPEKFKGPVKFGSPHFVDFGRNMEHSPDGKAYLVAHGSLEPDEHDRKANLSWITGDQIYLCRVTPSPETINDANQYEFYAGGNQWSRRLAEAKPIAEWNNNMGCVTMTYNAPLKRYLMCVTDGGNTVGKYNTCILESASITGPWKLVAYLKDFGKEAYFVNVPSKFISADGRTLWLCYSANFAHQNKPEWIDPPGSRYAMCLQEIKLKENQP
jgi:hypothetical protein